MKKLPLILATGAASALLAMGLSGCITFNTTAPANNTNTANTETSSNSANANNENNANNANTNTANDNKNVANTSNTSNTSSNTSSSGKAALGATQKFGSAKTGYIKVPEDWKDRTKDDFSSQQIDSSAITYVVDPTTEYTSAALAHYAFASSIKLETFPCKYTEKADEYYHDYQAKSDDYSDLNIEKDQFSGRSASVVSCESIDGVKITHIVFDKQSTAPGCIAITATATPSNNDAILSYVSTWSES